MILRRFFQQANINFNSKNLIKTKNYQAVLPCADLKYFYHNVIISLNKLRIFSALLICFLKGEHTFFGTFEYILIKAEPR